MSDSSPANVTDWPQLALSLSEHVFLLLPLPAACLGTASLWGHLLEILAWLLACTLHTLTMILFKNGTCENFASFGLAWVSSSH